MKTFKYDPECFPHESIKYFGLHKVCRIFDVLRIKKEIRETFAKILNVKEIVKDNVNPAIMIYCCYEKSRNGSNGLTHSRIVEIEELLNGKKALEILNISNLGNIEYSGTLGLYLHNFIKRFRELNEKDLDACGLILVSKVLIGVLDGKHTSEFCRILRNTLNKFMDGEKIFKIEDLTAFGEEIHKLEAAAAYKYNPAVLVSHTGTRSISLEKH